MGQLKWSLCNDCEMPLKSRARRENGAAPKKLFWLIAKKGYGAEEQYEKGCALHLYCQVGTAFDV